MSDLEEPATSGAHGRHAEPRGTRIAAGVVGVLILSLGIIGLTMSRSTAARPTGSTALPSSSVAPGATPSAPVASGDTTSGPVVVGTTEGSSGLPAAQSTLVLGDSLGLVVYPYLADLVPDRYVTYDGEVGRSTAGTAAALRRLFDRGEVPPVVIISTGTNDQRADDFTANATAILDLLGTGRCVVMADVVRPDSYGDSQTAMNAALDAVVSGRPNVSVLRWSTLISEHPEWLSRDGIHPRDAGAVGRAEAFAEASRTCSATDPSAPRAARQTLPNDIFYGPIAGGSTSGTSGSGGSNGNGSSGNGSGGNGSNGGGQPTASSTPTTTPTSTGAPTSTPTPTGSPTSTATAPPPPPPSTTPATPAPTTTAPKPTTTPKPTITPKTTSAPTPAAT